MVTLGVGNDTVAERKVQLRFPKCQFFGADPSGEENSPLFEKIGAFFEVAVGAKRQTMATFVWHPGDFL